MSRGRRRIFLLAGMLFILVFPIGVFALSDEAAKLFEEGQQAASRGDHKKAVEYYEKVVELDTNFAPVYAALGASYEQMSAPVGDVAWFYDTAVSVDPQFIEAYDTLCRVCYQGGEFDRAEAACLKALELNPAYPSAQMSLAWIYLLGKSQPDKAIFYFRKVLERIKHPKVYFGLGMAYSMNGDRAEVLDVVTTLRGMGEVDLAAQLERSIRESIPQPLPQDYVPMPQREPGTIVRSTDEPEPTPEPTSSPISGQTQIRLRGKLTGMGGQSQEHPASLEGTQPAEDSDAVPHTGGSSAIERIRKLQRVRQGTGTSGTTVQQY